MIAAISAYKTVKCLMRLRGIAFNDLARRSGIDPYIVAAIVSQRYTPSPEQRVRIAGALNFPHNRIVWGHIAAVDTHLPERP